jgi:hypothetical protein
MNLLWDNSFAAFLILTVVLGGGAALMSGRALALGWRPWLQAVLYMVPLALAVRFFHWSLAGGTLVSIHYFTVDLLVLAALTLLSWRVTRASQMVTQYPWLYRRAGPLGWTDKSG